MTRGAVELGFPLGLELSSSGADGTVLGNACGGRWLERREKRGWEEEW